MRLRFLMNWVFLIITFNTEDFIKKIFLSFTALVLIGFSAQAGFLVDPYMGYMVSGSNNNNFTISGQDMGIRLGWTTLGLGLGVDATVAGKYSYKNGTTTDYSPSHTGVFVSYTFPILIRGYATYFFSSKVSSSSPTSVSTTGNGTKLGVQYTGLPFIALGIEYYTMNYTEVEISGSKMSASGSESQTRLALSVPFNL